jgi:transcription initiation factor TFIID subunit 11
MSHSDEDLSDLDVDLDALEPIESPLPSGMASGPSALLPEGGSVPATPYSQPDTPFSPDPSSGGGGGSFFLGGLGLGTEGWGDELKELIADGEVAPEEDVLMEEEATAEQGDEEEEGFRDSSPEPEDLATVIDVKANLHALLEHFSPEQRQRYEVYRSTVLNKKHVKHLMAPLFPGQVKTEFAVVVAGVAKVFVGEIIELARHVQASWGDDPSEPLRPEHMREAYIRYQQQRGKMPPGIGERKRLFS